jgi:hypothetical protein
MKPLKKVNRFPANESSSVIQHGKITSKRLIRSGHQKIITICMIIVGIMLPINSCQKESTLPNNPQSTLTKLQKLNNTERAEIAGADAIGAAIGAAAGSAGGPIGAAFGALAGGIAASVLMRAEIKQRDGESLTANVSQVCLPNLDEGDGSAGNEDNPYDYVGKTHYQVMNVLLADHSLYCNTNGNFSLETCSTSIVNVLPTFATMPVDMGAVSIVDLQTCINNKEMPLENILPLTGLNPALYGILIEYRDFANASPNFNTFRMFSIMKEGEILYSSFSEMEKQVALSYMSTLRWGTWYWENIMD